MQHTNKTITVDVLNQPNERQRLDANNSIVKHNSILYISHVTEHTHRQHTKHTLANTPHAQTHRATQTIEINIEIYGRNFVWIERPW